MTRSWRWMPMWLLLWGCGEAGRATDLPLEVTFPVTDVTVPPGDPGTEPGVGPDRETVPVDPGGLDAVQEDRSGGGEDGSFESFAGDLRFSDIPGDPSGSDARTDDGNEDRNGSGGPCPPGSLTCRCESDEDCDPAYGDACRPNRCVREAHRCMLDSGIREGEPCDDGDVCTTGETCQRGICRGGVATCECRTDGDCPDDGNPCTDPKCDLGRCSHRPNEAPCEDGDGCTEGDRCAEGACVSGLRLCECDADLRCDDGLPCTVDRCLEGTCDHLLEPSWCRIEGRCVFDGTSEPTAPCLVCRSDRDPLGWTARDDGEPCSDGNPCTEPDQCRAGACVSGPMVCECVETSTCDDGNPCTDDRCVDFACRHVPNALPCEDGDPTTLGDVCAEGLCRPGPRCGDAVCERPRETCATCPADCGACPSRETLCGDGWDDDLDGSTDCGDPDCTWLPPCTPDTCAKVDGTVTCGFRITSHMAVGNEATGRACGASMSGDDTVWRFVSPTTRQVTFRVEDPFLEDDVEVFVLSGACNPVTCIGRDWGWRAQVTFTAEAGRPYYLVYDEVVWAARVDVQVSCP